MSIDQSADINAIDDPATLLAEGRAASARDDKPTARAALRKATKLAPASIDAWLALAEVVGTMSERRQAYERVLALEPANAAAQAGLAALTTRKADPPPLAAAAPLTPIPAAAATTGTCYRHPNVETGLRCIQCERPICARCAKATPVGFICPECRKARRSPLYQVTPVDVAKAVAVGLAAGVLGSVVSAFLGGAVFLLIFFLGPLVGEGVMRMITWATRKRGAIMQAAAAGSIALGAAAGYFFLPGNLVMLLIFLAIAIGTVVTRLK